EANDLGRTATELSTNLERTLLVLGNTLEVAGNVGQRFGLDQPWANPPARPFDIQDYTAALTRFNQAITNLHQLSLTADQLTRSEGWKRALQDVTEVTDRRVDRAFRSLCLAIGLAFVLAVLYRIISIKLSQRLARGNRENP